MKKLSEINLLKITRCLSIALAVFGLQISTAYAACPDDIGPLPDYVNLFGRKNIPNLPEEVGKLFDQAKVQREQLVQFCKNTKCSVSITTKKDIAKETITKCMQDNGTFAQYEQQRKAYNNLLTQMKVFNDNYRQNGGVVCGDDYPYGCPTGQTCWTQKYSSSVYTGYGAMGNVQRSEGTKCKCSSKPLKGWNQVSTGESCDAEGSITAFRLVGDDQYKVEYNTNNTKDEYVVKDRVTVFSTDGIVAQGQKTTKHIYTDETGQKFIETIVENNARSNAGYCKIDQLKKDYMENCYSCTIVASLINTFMTVASKTAPLAAAAGVKLLVIGMFLWLAFFVLKQISALVVPEPMDILNNLLKFFLKCVVAYTFITSGLGLMTKLFVNPVLSFGADYGISVIDAVMPKTAADVDDKKDIENYDKVSAGLIDQRVFDKIMTLSKRADSAVSLNLVVANALTCHAGHAGAIQIAKDITDLVGLEFYFPNFWLWICGAAMWVMGLMLVIGINFYLLDISFKIGFGLLALPITLALWPFDKFQNKFTECFKIIVNAAGTFLFLGITVGVSLVLINAGLGGTDDLLNAIASDNKEYVAQQFSFAGARVFIVAFVFLYSHKLISATVSKMTNKFFGAVTGNINHMHGMAAGTADYLGKKAKEAVGGKLGNVAGKVGKGIDKAVSGVVNGAASAMRKGGKKLGGAARKVFHKRS